MKRSILLVSFLLFAAALYGRSDSLVRTRGWFLAPEVRYASMLCPALQKANSLQCGVELASPALYGGYRLNPNIRLRGGLWYMAMKFDAPNRVSKWNYGHPFTSDDRGQYLLADFQAQFFALPSRFRLQPYIAPGIVLREYWLQKNHEVYEAGTRRPLFSVHDRYNGLLLQWSANVGLQYRLSRCVELFTNGYGVLNLLDYRDDPLWEGDNSHIWGISLGLNYHFQKTQQ